MYYAADKQKAEQVLKDLRSIRTDAQASALARLHHLRNEVACERSSDLARLQAWQSIRRLYDALKAGSAHDLRPQWQDAIAKTAAWHESLR